METNRHKNRNLNKAKSTKNDEFYTKLCDIESEIRHVRGHFRGKTVYCNCDDPRLSNFFYYFLKSFKRLGIKRLISSFHEKQNFGLFKEHAVAGGWLEYSGRDTDASFINEVGINRFRGDGDFRSPECIELLKQSDIVVTNPPFSLFREFILLMMEYDKKFLVLGSINAAHYKDIFPFLKDGLCWLGVNNGGFEFQVPKDSPSTVANIRVDSDGNRFAKMGNIVWFTNLEHGKRNENLVLTETFTPDRYPAYDNCKDAVEVPRVALLPKDYFGEMGVPISFLNKHNPDQFELVGRERDKVGDSFYLNGKEKFKRILIKRKTLFDFERTRKELS